METTNIYLFKALDAYPYNLEEAMEALQYTLSYEPDNAQALYLMAKIYAFQLRDYEAAKYYFEATIASNMGLATVYPDYVYTLMYNEEYPEAQRLLDYAIQVRGSDKAVLQLQQGQLFEALEKYKEAMKALKIARKKGKNNDFVRFVGNEINRVRKKLPKNNKKSKRSKKKGGKK